MILIYFAAAAYIFVSARAFSFGVYNLRNGNAGAFAVTLLLLAAGAALLCLYALR